jgi:alkanesulfonate monooxygenase SsuD/methylene tetrahydromethanopterin reductase-like flavin-dependent oxidoreductase (luciferase family)
MADERAIAEHVVPKITKAAEGAGRPAPRVVAGVAVCLCPTSEIDRAVERANDALGHAEYSPNYQRLLEAGESDDVGDMSAIGTEADIERRLRSYMDAGTTDFSARILPLGSSKDEIVASSRRTREFLASLAPELS